MKLFRFLLILTFLSGLSFAIDPKDAPPPVTPIDTTSSPATSVPYAMIVSQGGELVQFLVTGTGTFTIEGTLDTEADVKASTATWAEIYSEELATASTIRIVQTPPSYLRVKVTPSTAMKVKMRSATGLMRFRVVQ